MKPWLARIFLVVLFQVFCVGSVWAAEVRLSAATTLAEALREIIGIYTQRVPGVNVLPNFAASGALAKQIEQGAPVDLFISANARWMDHLVAQGKVDAESVRILTGNSLVFVGRKGLQISALEDLPRLERIALVNPKSGPAGEYAEQALRAAALYDRLAGRLVLAQDVRQAVVYADRGEVDGAFVYRTDALLAQQAVILYEVPAELHEDISYPMAVTLSGSRSSETLEFFLFLQGLEARQVLERYGFIAK